MEVISRIEQELTQSQRDKDELRTLVLRQLKTVLVNAQIANDRKDLTEDQIVKLFRSEVKKRKEAADIFKQQNRADLAEVELYQAGVMEVYLPKQMSEDEIKAEVTKIIAQVGATSAADMGKVMGAASKALAGKADNKIVSQFVKELLK